MRDMKGGQEGIVILACAHTGSKAVRQSQTNLPKGKKTFASGNPMPPQKNKTKQTKTELWKEWK